MATDPVSPGTTDREEEEVNGRNSRETKLGMLLTIVRSRRRRMGRTVWRVRNRLDRFLFRVVGISVDVEWKDRLRCI